MCGMVSNADDEQVQKKYNFSISKPIKLELKYSFANFSRFPV
jgi:hypothetical protein